MHHNAATTMEFTIAFGMSMSVVRIIFQTIQRCPELKNLDIIIPLQKDKFDPYRYTAKGNQTPFEKLYDEEYTPIHHEFNLREYKEYLQLLTALGVHKEWNVTFRFVLQEEAATIISNKSIVIALDPSLQKDDQEIARRDVAKMLESVDTTVPFLYCDHKVLLYSLEMMTGTRGLFEHLATHPPP